MSVRKRILPASGKTVWLVDYRDGSGQRRAKQFATKRAASDWLDNAKGEIRAGTHVADSASITLKEAADLWIAAGQADALERTTVRQREQHARLHIVPLIGAVKLTQLTTPRIEAFKDELLEARSRAMSRAVLTSLKGILTLARRRGLIGHNPAEAVAIGKRRHEEEGEVVIPSKDVIRDMVLNSAERFPLSRKVSGRWIAGQGRQERMVPVPWRALLITAVFTGMRASELRGLRWPNVDLKAGTIRVRERADRYQRLGPPKSAAGRRDIPLAPIVINTLKEWSLVCPRTDLELVFPSESGAVIGHTNLLRQGFHPLLQACGLMTADATDPPFPFHALRHAAASLFIEQGWSPKKVQTVMRHSSITVTYDIYGHLFPTPDDDQEAMAQLQARLLK
jgi:integrase